jgi:inositol oxygenase
MSPLKRTVILDLSEIYRPEAKNVDNFRDFDYNQIENNPLLKRVFNTYLEMHTKQTVEFVTNKKRKWLQFNHAEMTIMDALHTLNMLIDESDPDIDLPNIVHAFQTAERARQIHPDEDWFHLTGLIHDLGKVMALWGEPQWAVVGDTFPVGCLPSPSVVFRNYTFQENPDLLDGRYNTKYGMYEPNGGLENLLMSWGHDEYLYQVLKHHETCTLPDEALYMIRFHSFYPWHSGGDYWYLANETDRKMFYWIREFNKFDLYSKSDQQPDLDELKLYYQSLIDKYVPGLVKF